MTDDEFRAELARLEAAVADAKKRRDDFVRQNRRHPYCRGCGCELTLDSSLRMGVCEDCE